VRTMTAAVSGAVVALPAVQAASSPQLFSPPLNVRVPVDARDITPFHLTNHHGSWCSGPAYHYN
jgi:hypothetical protein